MSEYDEIRVKAHEQDESLLPSIDEYEHLKARFFTLTGNPKANEAFNSFILEIADEATRREAIRVARRMRDLTRYVFSRLT